VESTSRKKETMWLKKGALKKFGLKAHSFKRGSAKRGKRGELAIHTQSAGQGEKARYRENIPLVYLSRQTHITAKYLAIIKNSLYRERI